MFRIEQDGCQFGLIPYLYMRATSTRFVETIE